MTKRIVRLAALLMALATLAGASTIMFGLDGDPDQIYSFTPVGSPAGIVETVAAGPYLGWLGDKSTPNENYFFSLGFTGAVDPAKSYPGTVFAPSTAQELEAAYLGADLVSLGNQNASMAEKGATSMAIWQIMDPTPGEVPRDPAAQWYVNAAIDAYSRGALSAASFPETLIFDAHDPHIPEFMVTAEYIPEPGSIVLFVIGAGLIGMSRLYPRNKK